MNLSKNVFTEEFAKLNQAQKQAVETIYGPVIVLAGPGSGKTQILSMRIGQILQITDTLPSSILCLSFTEAAASNMRKRLHSLIGPQAHQVAFHTFHSFGSEIINQHPEHFFFGASFAPVDEIGQYQILRQIFKSLPWNNPLSSYSEDHDYSYLSDSLDAIQRLKQGGISEVDFSQILSLNRQFLQEVNEISKPEFELDISKKNLETWPQFYYNFVNIASKFILQAKNYGYTWLKVYPILAETMLLEIELANQQIQAENSQELDVKPNTKTITKWKNSNLEKDRNNQSIFKEYSKLDKQEALIEIYTKYQKELFKQGLYDFADMLMQVVNKLEDKEKPELAFNLQEKYQYILVDEFQDTNGVQLRLLLNLLNSNILDFQPNVLVVGDDDQAVYKFQGANIQNLWKFQENFPKSEQIALSLNYRSDQDILDVASQVISQASQRFSEQLGVNKELISAKK